MVSPVAIQSSWIDNLLYFLQFLGKDRLVNFTPRLVLPFIRLPVTLKTFSQSIGKKELIKIS